MAKPKVELKYYDQTEDRGYLQPVVNGTLITCVCVSFDNANSPHFLRQLEGIIEAAYQLGHKDADDAARKKVRDLVAWADDF